MIFKPYSWTDKSGLLKWGSEESLLIIKIFELFFSQLLTPTGSTNKELVQAGTRSKWITVILKHKLQSEKVNVILDVH